MISSFISIASLLLIFFVLVYLLAVKIENNGIVDIAWGIGFVLIAFNAFFFQGSTLSRLLLLIIVTLWGLRLALHIYLRGRGQGEDFRYRKWREQWGDIWVIRSFFQIYLLQWFFMQIVAAPIYLGILSPKVSLGILSLIGVIIWTIGFFFEAVGDYQLTVFKRDPSSKGKIMTTGLWRYTRHPNYFGEAVLWWGVALIAYDLSGSWLVFISPLFIDYLLLYVSGIPMLEKKYQGRDDWEKYARTTSAFFPLPPRSTI